jgi:cytochrome c oxidase subunit 2
MGTATAAIAAATTTACSRPEGTALPGKELYAACVACHGADGSGNKKLGAPSIGGLPAWYVESQVTKFKTGARGAHPDDFEGLRMRPMARQMMNEAEVKAVAAYVGSLPRRPVPTTLEGGDAQAGAAVFAPCVACHGAAGQGNEQLKAPPIAGQADWYLLAQLKKFRAGVRGTDSRDTWGLVMRPTAVALPSDKAVLDVVTHVSTLGR